MITVTFFKVKAALLQLGRKSTTIAPVSPDKTTKKNHNDRNNFSREMHSLNLQMHEVINKNADGVNRIAIAIRRESDILLSLGVSDSRAAKAGTIAQKALELANKGRGENLQYERVELTPDDRAALVAQAIMLVNKAEKLMADAKKGNRKNIDAAITKQALYLIDLNQLTINE